MEVGIQMYSQSFSLIILIHLHLHPLVVALVYSTDKHLYDPLVGRTVFHSNRFPVKVPSSSYSHGNRFPFHCSSCRFTIIIILQRVRPSSGQKLVLPTPSIQQHSHPTRINFNRPKGVEVPVCACLFSEEDHHQDVAIHNEANQRDNGKTYVEHIEGSSSQQQQKQRAGCRRRMWREQRKAHRDVRRDQLSSSSSSSGALG